MLGGGEGKDTIHLAKKGPGCLLQTQATKGNNSGEGTPLLQQVYGIFKKFHEVKDQVKFKSPHIFATFEEEKI